MGFGRLLMSLKKFVISIKMFWIFVLVMMFMRKLGIRFVIVIMRFFIMVI